MRNSEVNTSCIASDVITYSHIQLHAHLMGKMPEIKQHKFKIQVVSEKIDRYLRATTWELQIIKG